MYQEANFKVSSLDSLVSAGTQGRVVLSWEKALLNPLTRSLSRSLVLFGLLITFKLAGKWRGTTVYFPVLFHAGEVKRGYICIIKERVKQTLEK